MRMKALLIAYTAESLRNAMLVMMPVIVLALTFIWSLMGKDGPVAFFQSATLMMCIYMVGFQLPAITLAEDKEKRTLEAVFLSPARPLDVIGARTVLTALLTVVTAAGSLAIYGAMPARVDILLLGFGLGLLFTMAIGTTVGLIASDQKSSSLIATPIMMVLLMGAIMPWQEVLPGFWSVSRWLPTRPMFELIAMGITGTEEPVLQDTLVMLPYVALVLVICARQVRRWASLN